jgi:hypothetical protein
MNLSLTCGCRCAPDEKRFGATASKMGAMEKKAEG